MYSSKLHLFCHPRTWHTARRWPCGFSLRVPFLHVFCLLTHVRSPNALRVDRVCGAQFFEFWESVRKPKPVRSERSKMCQVLPASAVSLAYKNSRCVCWWKAKRANQAGRLRPQRAGAQRAIPPSQTQQPLQTESFPLKPTAFLLLFKVFYTVNINIYMDRIYRKKFNQ